MMSSNSEDLFICGKCRSNFTDLNLFLTHRSTCNGNNETSVTLQPYALTTESTTLLTDELDAIIQDVDLMLPETADLFNPSVPAESISSNDFEDLFASTNVNETEHLSLENGLSQMSLLECPVCDEQFDAPTVLENHVFEHSTVIDEHDSTNNKSNIPVDESSSSYVDLLDEPVSSPLECKQCTVTFTSNASLNIHKKLIHCLNPVFRCLNDACAQLFDKPGDYILHARVHSQKRLRRSARAAAYHRRRKRTFRCRVCKKIFSSSEQLQHHLNYETHQFLCQLCLAEFDSNNSYHNHLAKHADAALYRCTICIETFQKRNDLSRHVLTKHNEDLPNQKSCASCKLTFKTTFHLNRHNNTKHSDVKPYKCDQDGCEQAFARKDKLKQHAAKHTAEGGMFKCNACFKTFVRPEHLRDHDIVRHSRQYPFTCEYCGKGFLHQNQLYAHHKQRHANENQLMKEENDFVQQESYSNQLGANDDSSDFFL